MDALLVYGRAVEGGEAGLPFRHADHLAAGQIDRLAAVRQERGEVGREERAAVPVVSDDDAARVAEAEGDYAAGFARGEGGDGVGALYSQRGGADGLLEVGAVVHVALYEMGHALGIGLGGEDVALGDKLALEGDVVLDDAVMDDGHLAPAVGMRVGVGVGGAAVRSPPGVAYAGVSGGHIAVQGRGEVIELAALLVHAGRAVLAYDGDAGAVVAPVRERRQPLHQDRRGLPLAGIAYYPAHGDSPANRVFPISRRVPVLRAATLPSCRRWADSTCRALRPLP